MLAVLLRLGAAYVFFYFHVSIKLAFSALTLLVW